MERTADIHLSEEHDNITFDDLPLDKIVVQGLKTAGFLKPSPIQLKAIPLAKFGTDLVAQAKSGTGKTCVFATIAIDFVYRYAQKEGKVQPIQVLVLAPTREIAVQIKDVIMTIGSSIDCIRAYAFIGGLPVSSDKAVIADKCPIAVGTPGRVNSLIKDKIMPTQHIRMLVLDEADKLLEDEFAEEIVQIIERLPERKQILIFSATFSAKDYEKLGRFMRSPQVCRTCGTAQTNAEIISIEELLHAPKSTPEADTQEKSMELWLHGVRQYYCLVDDATTKAECFRIKIVRLGELFSELRFRQCIVFCNDKPRSQALASSLTTLGWEAACIVGGQPQEDRLEAMTTFRESRVRILISTDVTARGIDVDKVDLVICLDLPRQPATYLHRVGRAGRFGTYGTAITMVTKKELKIIQALAGLFDMEINPLSSTFKEGDANSCSEETSIHNVDIAKANTELCSAKITEDAQLRNFDDEMPTEGPVDEDIVLESTQLPSPEPSSPCTIDPIDPSSTASHSAIATPSNSEQQEQPDLEEATVLSTIQESFILSSQPDTQTIHTVIQDNEKFLVDKAQFDYEQATYHKWISALNTTIS